MTPKKKLIYEIKGAVGRARDNLHRAKIAFKGYSKKQLNRSYGQLGQTPCEILQEYKAELKLCEKAMELINETFN